MRESVLDQRKGTAILSDWPIGSHPFHNVVQEKRNGRCVLTVGFSPSCPLCQEFMARRLLLNTPGTDGPRPAA
jgi:hypothetical protein